MASKEAEPEELDPSITAPILRGVAEDIESGRVKVVAFIRPTRRGAETTLVVNYIEVKK